jgi:hypothetical protein
MVPEPARSFCSSTSARLLRKSSKCTRPTVCDLSKSSAVSAGAANRALEGVPLREPSLLGANLSMVAGSVVWRERGCKVASVVVLALLALGSFHGTARCRCRANRTLHLHTPTFICQLRCSHLEDAFVLVYASP